MRFLCWFSGKFLLSEVFLIWEVFVSVVWLLLGKFVGNMVLLNFFFWLFFYEIVVLLMNIVLLLLLKLLMEKLKELLKRFYVISLYGMIICLFVVF